MASNGWAISRRRRGGGRFRGLRRGREHQYDDIQHDDVHLGERGRVDRRWKLGGQQRSWYNNHEAKDHGDATGTCDAARYPLHNRQD